MRQKPTNILPFIIRVKGDPSGGFFGYHISTGISALARTIAEVEQNIKAQFQEKYFMDLDGLLSLSFVYRGTYSPIRVLPTFDIYLDVPQPQ